jgi:hypothetical protein
MYSSTWGGSDFSLKQGWRFLGQTRRKEKDIEKVKFLVIFSLA